MSSEHTPKEKLRRIVFFFPIQLVFMHLKRNHLLLLFWLFLFAVVSGNLGIKYGVPYLFLSPEYLGEVGMGSHLILGFALGGFIMAFNLYSYVMYGFEFPFIATLSRPFLKFSINNFIIPATFIAVFMVKASIFQYQKEFLDASSIAMNMFSFLVGLVIFLTLSQLYFFRTNKDIFKFLGKTEKEFISQSDKHVLGGNVLHKKQPWYVLKGQKGWLVITYMSGFAKIKLARESKHYDKNILQKVFQQNHINASVFELLLLVSFVVIGSFREIPVFTIPAAASLVLVFTVILLLYSAFYSWFKGWTLTVIVVLFLLINWGTGNLDFMMAESQAYGLNYDGKLADYNHDQLKKYQGNVVLQEQDHVRTEAVLNNWRNKLAGAASNENSKPKLIIVASSGGGLRSSLWSFHVLQHADSLSDGQLLNQTHLMTGSSGGMVGAAYLRELYLLSATDSTVDYNLQKYIDRLGRDILNPIGFSIATNDIFVRYQSHTLGEHSYTKDRGFAFEHQLNLNTNNILNKSLCEYREPETNALIPTMILAPTVVNDGRRLLISSQDISYLSNNFPKKVAGRLPLTENIEFRRFFEAQEADSLQFTSALRMSATFPYIMPLVSMPTQPKIEVMDAGLRDNFGFLTSIQYIWEFREWIEENTSGVVILQIRDTEKFFDMEDKEINSFSESLTSPAGSLYANFIKIQDYEQDQLMQYTGAWLDTHVDVVTFSLRDDEEEKVSLSWHLTNFEKQRIKESITLPENKLAMQRLLELLETN